MGKMIFENNYTKITKVGIYTKVINIINILQLLLYNISNIAIYI